MEGPGREEDDDGLTSIAAAMSNQDFLRKELKNFKLCEDLKKCEDGCSCNADADCDICKVIDFTMKKEKL